MLKKSTFTFLFSLLAMAGISAAATITPVIPNQDNGDCYLIGSAAELYGFAAIVNGTGGHTANPEVCGELTSNIVVNEDVLTSAGELNKAPTGGFLEWTPIGNKNNPFRGWFYGEGHTISGLYFNNSGTDDVGLFGYTSGKVTIDGVGVVDSYFSGNKNVGGIVGRAAVEKTKTLSVTNSYNMGSVIGTSNVGGLVGKNGNVKFSYNTGSVTGTENVGGLVGSNIENQKNDFEINDSYNVGLVSKGDGSGNFVLGEGCPTDSLTSAVRNVYYLEGFGDECLGAISMTSREFAEGLVASMLHNDSTVLGADIWGQVVGSDKTPTLTGEIKFLLSEGCFEIASEEDLYFFAVAVNNGVDSDVCVKLTKNIVVNKNVLANVNADGSLKDDVNVKKWIPIGNKNNPFRGWFHGQGHTISGLYFNDAYADDVGLFGHVSEYVTIDSVGLEDSYIKACDYVGGLVGFARGSLTISDSYNASSVNTRGSSFGGLVGGAVGTLSISNSYNVGSLNGVYWGGGLVGNADALIVSNSYNAGPVYISGAGTYVGGVTPSVAKTSTVTNCFNFGTISYPTGNRINKDDLVAKGGDGAVTVTNSFSIGKSRFEDNGATKMSTDKFKDGTVFVALRSAEGGEVWHQSKNDAYPTLAPKTDAPMHVITLHYSETDSVVIAYTEGTVLTLPAVDKDGKYVIWYDEEGTFYIDIPLTANGDLTLHAVEFKLGSDGVYEIANADMLYKFAAIVNGGESTAKAKLTANIVVNRRVLAGEGGVSNVDATTGAYTGSTTGLRKWTPIGNNSNPFNGTFDGQGHTISGLYFNDANELNVGLFGYVSGDEIVTISNVGVKDSYFNAQSAVGGVVGWVDYASLDMKNVYNAAVVVGTSFVGGVVGYVGLNSQTLSMTNVYNVGLINCEDAGQAGGLVGEFGNDSEEAKVTIKNSYNYGEVVGGNSLVGYVESEYENVENVSVSNSYYLGDAAQGDYGTVKSSTEFADGTVFAALHSAEGGYVWVQAPGGKFPTIDINASENANIVVLDWSTAADSITLANAGYSEGDIVVVKGGKQFYADGKIYEGVLSAEQVAAIGENYLYPISGVKLENVNGKLVATLDGNSSKIFLIPTDIAVSKVICLRDLIGGIFQTIMLPFNAPLDSEIGVKFYEFKEVAADYNVKVSTVKDKILANKPYIVVANSGITQMKFAPEGGLTLVKSTSDVYEVRKGNWVMKGVYKTKVFDDDDTELGRAYGFAGQQQDGTKIGEFVKVGAEAFASPMRVYLVNDSVQQARPGQNDGNSFALIQAVPESLSVVNVDDEEDAKNEIMVVKRITVVPTVVPTNRWFDMKGRALDAKPTAKGTYYYNGQRVIIK